MKFQINQNQFFEVLRAKLYTDFEIDDRQMKQECRYLRMIDRQGIVVKNYADYSKH